MASQKFCYLDMMNSTQNITNSSCISKPEAAEEAVRVFIAVCLSIIIAGSFLGNTLVCIAFKVNENLRVVSNYFILNLAISDLVTTICVMPFDLDIIKRRSWTHGEPMCEFYTTMYLISAPASILNLLAVSIDRFRLISNPFHYERTTTPSRALIVIGCVWIYATLMALLPIMGWKKDHAPTNNCTEKAPQCFFPIAEIYSYMISVLHFVIPPLVMTVIYFKIYKIARSHASRIHRLESISVATNGRTPLTYDVGASNGRPSAKDGSPLAYCGDDSNGDRAKGGQRKSTYSTTASPTQRKNVKAAKSLALIVGTFFACWYPFTLASLVGNACGGLSGIGCMPPYAYDCLLTIGYLNCMLNPFLYALHNKEFKRTYKRLLGWKYR